MKISDLWKPMNRIKHFFSTKDVSRKGFVLNYEKSVHLPLLYKAPDKNAFLKISKAVSHQNPNFVFRALKLNDRGINIASVILYTVVEHIWLNSL